MKSINKNLQDYFIKLAPDFSVFDMVEKYYHDNDIVPVNGVFKDLFFYRYNIIANTNIVTPFYRGMFLILMDESSGDGAITINGNSDEYTVFPYKEGYILIAIQDDPIEITCSKDIDLVIGVAF
jgi:hypothetical protein